MKKCTTCQKTLIDSVRFCSQCGGSSFESLNTIAGTIEANPTPNTATDSTIEDSKGMSGGNKTAGIILSVLLTVFTLAISLLVIFKVTFSEENRADIADSFAEEITDIEIGALLGEEDDSTLDEYIYAQFPDSYQYFVSERDIRKLLKENFVVEFVEEKVKDYTSDLFYNNGDGKIDADEIVELLEDNRRSIEKLTNYSLTDADLKSIEKNLEKNIDWDAFELSTYAKGNYVFAALRVAFSPAVLVILSIIACLLIIWILVICKNKKFAFSCIGISMLVTGVLNGIFVLATFILADPLKNHLSYIANVIDDLLQPARYCGLIEFAAFAGVGIAILAVIKLTGMISAKKAAK